MNSYRGGPGTLLLLATLTLVACGSGGLNHPQPTDPPEPDFAVSLFSSASANIDNPHLPFVPGTTHLFLSEGDEDVEVIVLEVLDQTRLVAGVTCRVVRERVYGDGLLVEDLHDSYAQDDVGNVWVLGEEVDSFTYDPEGNLISTDHEGAWETGLDVAHVGVLAEPGIVMKAVLQVGDSYRQEYYEGEAEDRGEIVGLGVPVTLGDGSMFTCLRTRDTTRLEPTAVEFKYYALGIGLVLEESWDGEERVERRGTFDQIAASRPDFGAVLERPFPANGCVEARGP